ncbi:Crp/Fnr family transcriptional regulator [Dyadobacter sp. CY107]|uniref:Crp/Fnr family transcriptional regulator n=1 Tax=Dyadobacter fanqingshengii TaxID=2906443 RepID=UPI001F20FB67|nr:Crp/Fnr family transcriptional regulator [Dyadobacter fanqingshengii]MCF2506102.1 Crp/Fnr family transcriptional regulator [Dyadobacter fanqingshengii]
MMVETEMEVFFKKVRQYTQLTQEAEAAWAKLLVRKVYKKNDFLISEGQVPRKVSFITEGLFSQYFTASDGNVVIKKFFMESQFAASVVAMLKKEPSIFTIKALENSVVWEYDFAQFKKLTLEYEDIAAFYISYMELHWIIEKEPLEISFRYDTASVKYAHFLRSHPALEDRLKQHEIASYLGITPTQLSRIRSQK